MRLFLHRFLTYSPEYLCLFTIIIHIIPNYNLYKDMGNTFPYKTEKNPRFPGQPRGKTEIFRKNYKFSTLNGQKDEKIPFWPIFADLAPTVADEVVLRAAWQKLAAHLPPK